MTDFYVIFDELIIAETHFYCSMRAKLSILPHSFAVKWTDNLQYAAHWLRE